MNRRELIETAWAALAAASRLTAANDRVQVAVVGVGRRGSSLVEHFARRNDSTLVAVCDVNTAQIERAAQRYYSARGQRPKGYQDIRKLYEDPAVDAVFIAAPNHWHALAAIWACQAGKDVYVEKPVSYNPFESERLVNAARRYSRLVQGGMQRRSVAHKKRAAELLRAGALGKVYMARAVCFKRRASIGRKPDGPVPPGLDWDLFLGPAPMRPYNENRYNYNWHWFWDTGNGEIGNQGVHELDYAIWALNKKSNPLTVYSQGGKYVYDDDQETPNTQVALYDYGDLMLSFEARALPTGSEGDLDLRGGNFIGNLFFGEKGYMTVDDAGFKIFYGENREPGEAMKVVEAKEDESTAHITNFFEAVRSRQAARLAAEVQDAALSADLVHIANISYRLGRKLRLEAGRTRFVGDEEANRLLTRTPYRAPYIVS